MARNTFNQDEKLKNEINISHIKRLGGYISKYKSKLIASIIYMLITSVLSLLPPFLIAMVVDVCLPEKNFRLLYFIVGAVIVSELLIWLVTCIRTKIINLVGMGLVRDLRHDLYSHLQYLPLSYFDSRPHGKILIRVVNYINALSQLLSNGIIDVVANLFTVLVIVVFMFIMDVEFALICIAFVPVFVTFILILKTKHRKAWQTLSSKQSNLTAYISESISGMKVTQSFARESKNSETFDNLCQDTKKHWLKARYIEFAIPVTVNVLSVISTVVVYLIGASRIAEGGLTLGVLIAFASYISRFWSPITVLTNYYNQIITATAYVERIFETMDEPFVVEDLPDAKPLNDIKGDVEFKNVTFAYEENEPCVLENVSFTAKAGESIALVGPTGAGKSTIINLISRFYDIQSGEILIDGHDIKHATLDSLRSQVGVMLQDSFLFSGTIKENIRYGKLDATDEEIIQAAKTVCAHDFIMSMPQGYDTPVNERGSSLSVGQRQLIAFARTLLSDPKILILDEATSSIDTETEMLLQQGLHELLKGRTSFIVAHRLSTIKQCDCIMHISNKNISERGSHDELLEKKGAYYDLYQAQFKFLNVD